MRTDNLVSLLNKRAKEHPEFPIFTYLQGGELADNPITFSELALNSRSIAAFLQRNCDERDRVMLLFPSGVEFVEAFMGCLYSQRIGVPLPPPRTSRIMQTLEKMQAIASSADPKVVLTTGEIADKAKEHFATMPELRAYLWVPIDQAKKTKPEEYVELAAKTKDIAYLQYTSGSTSLPKGVILTHANLMANMRYFDLSGMHAPESKLLTWLPAFHDLGLIYGLLMPILTRTQTYIMSNAAFIQRPSCWLEAISQYRITHTMGPNFSFDFSMRSVTAEQTAELDLSCWQYALNGAEPVRMEVMRRFAEYFRDNGFDIRIFSPSWGLAEASCIVTGSHYLGGKQVRHIPLSERRAPSEIFVDASALQQNRLVLSAPDKENAISLAGSGFPIDDTVIRIVDPATLQECEPDQIGELWVCNAAVSPGYWERPEQTKHTFKAKIDNSDDQRSYMRTGDLGFIYKNEIFIAGRLKDVIIIRGQNFYPQDIEWMLEQCHPLLRVGGSAAFSITVEEQERLAIVAEVGRRFKKEKDADTIFAKIRECISSRFDLQVEAMSLIRMGSIPKTTSGKIQRAGTRAAFLDGELKLQAQWRRERTRPTSPGVDVPRLSDWVRQKLAEYSGIAVRDIADDTTFGSLGLDSSQSVNLIGELEKAFSFHDLSPTLAYDYPSISKLSAKLASLTTRDPKSTVRGGTSKRELAIVGMSCRFPSAKNLQEFEELLWRREVVISAPDEKRKRLLGELLDNVEDLGNAGFIDDIEYFDPAFFNISAREATEMDPQQRLILQQVWHAIEDAGLKLEELANSNTGVFVGISHSDYAAITRNVQGDKGTFSGTGKATSISANRISYFLDLHGPSVAVDTACSSSLVALHQASQSIHAGECETAIVVGVNLILDPALSRGLRDAGMLSPTHACHSFCENADGYARGEGVGVLILQNSAALQKFSTGARARLLGSAINQDGRSHGLTAPNGLSQGRVLKAAIDNAGVDPLKVAYVEAHGTGTPLGDPIEISAIEKVYGVAGRKQPCLVGSVKANIGHLEAAAGIAGVIKTVLCMQKNSVPVQPNIQRLNPHLKFDSRNIDICRTPAQALTNLASTNLDYAAITSMGFGGTNAHIVLGSVAARMDKSGNDSLPSLQRFLILPISARSPKSLTDLCLAYAAYFETTPESLAAICASAATQRTHFDCRIAIAARDKRELSQSLRKAAEASRETSPQEHGAEPRLVMVFSGQGTQFPGMAEALYENSLEFKNIIDQADSFLQNRFGYKLLKNLYGKECLDARALAETQHTQVGVFVVEYALARLLQLWGLEPALLVGHSLGEYVAACVANVMSFEAALTLVYQRARLMSKCPGGGMLAVTASEDQMMSLLKDFNGDLNIAAVNSASQITIAGERGALKQFQELCKTKKIPAVNLPVSHAFHSSLMGAISQEFYDCANQLEYAPSILPIISNLYGEPQQDFNAQYWRDHLLNCVYFEKSVRRALDLGANTFIEVCAKSVLSTSIRQIVPDGMECLHTSLLEEGGLQSLSGLLCRLYEAGCDLNWHAIYQDVPRISRGLPLYPFDEKPYWPEAPKSLAAVKSQAGDTTQTISSNDTASVKPKMKNGNLNEELKDLLAPLLRSRPAELNSRKSFLEMGADSLVLVEFVRQISDRFQVELAMPTLFEELANISLLANWLEKNAVIEAPASEQGPEEGRSSSAGGQTEQEALRDSPLFSATGGQMGESGLQAILSRQLDAFNQLVAKQLDAIGGSHAATNAGQSHVQRSRIAPATTDKLKQPHGVGKSVTASGAGTHLGETQKAHLRRLIEKYQEKTSKSKRYAEEYREVFSDYRSSLGFRATTKELLYPLVVESAKGSKIVDLNGNTYIDLTMGFGSSLLGYNPEFIADAMIRQISGNGIQVGPKSPLTGKAARLIHELTGNERVAFANSGTEAVMTAIRLARAVTGRTKIVRFAGAYHGHADVTLVKKGLQSHQATPIAPGVPQSVAADALVLDFVDDTSLEIIREHLDDIAAILVEPIQSRRPGLQSAEFLRQLRELADRGGCALIFDEIITGFRLAQGGAQEYFGINADLVVYGKVAGGGMPLGIIAGNQKYMNAIDGGVWQYGDDSRPAPGATFFAGTFSGHPATMSATIAVLEKLKSGRGELQRQINDKTRDLVDRVNRFFTEQRFPIHVDRAGSLFRFVFFNNYSVEFQPVEANIFFYNMTSRGVYIWEGHTCFISEAHSREDLDRIFEAVKGSALAMRADGFFELDKQLGEDQAALAHLNTQAAAYIADYFGRLLGNAEPGATFSLQEVYKLGDVQEKYRPLVRRLAEVLEEHGLIRVEAEQLKLVRDFSVLARNINAYEHTPISVLKLLQRSANSLPDVLSGKLSPTDVLFTGEGYKWVESLYLDAPGSLDAIDSLCKAVKHFTDRKSGQIRILEVGAGTGSATKELVTRLRGVDYSYTFTDISAAFLNSASKLFRDNERFQYCTLDIEKSASDQGFTTGSFDVIVASNVVHATADLAVTLQNLRTLLSEDGCLVLLECVEKQAWLDLVFGLTDGWWRGLHCGLRSGYPLMPVRDWHSSLQNLGYVGLDIQSNDSGQAVICGSRGNEVAIGNPDAGINEMGETDKEPQPSLQLSDSHREILVHMEMAEDLNLAYNEGALFEISGELNVGKFQQAWSYLVNRHEALRVRVNREKKTFEHHGIAPEITQFDFSFLDSELAHTKAWQWIKNQCDTPFDIEQGPLIKASLLTVSNDNFLFFVIGHHLIIDGISYGVLIEEMLKIYQAFVRDEEVSLGEAMKLSAPATCSENPQARTYWQKAFSNGVPYLSLPVDKPFPEQQTFKAGRTTRRLDSALSQTIQRYCQQQGATPFMAFLAAWRILLHKLCNQSESVIGVPVSVHPSQAGKVFLGYGVNLLPLIQEISEAASFREVLAGTRENFFQALAYKNWPFSEVVKTVNPKRDPSRPSVITVLFNYEKIAGLGSQELRCLPIVPPIKYSKYELTLDVVFDGERFELVSTWNGDLFNADSADAMLARMQELLGKVTGDPDKAVGELDILLPGEDQRVFLSNAAQLSEADCLHRLFENQVKRNPEAEALRYENTCLSYAELNKRANQIAHYLQHRGVRQKDRVAVCLERAPELIACLLAVMKCGAAYVPLDPKYPRERLDAIVDDAKVALVLVGDKREYADWYVQGEEQTQVIGFVQSSDEIYQQKNTNPNVECTPRDLAYLIYTSGSTGVPKGVAIEHRNAHAMIAWAQKEFSREQLRGVLASTSICFDLSVFEIFLPLCAGTKVILVENILYLPELEKCDDITLINTVPSAIEELVKQNALPEQLEVVNLAGEALSLATVERIRQRMPEILVYNLYGPSEDTTYTTWLKIPPDRNEEVTIGKPIAGTKIYLLDDQLNPVPHGSTGTLYVAGEGLSRGYWNNPYMTASSFLPNPFSNKPGDRIYCTGDLGKLNPAGEIVFLGRRDHQVKVRGHRIELGEIETAIESIQGVQKAVVLVAGDAGKQLLYAFYSTANAKPTEEQEIISTLAKRLPAYMVPANFIFLEAMPLTPNGKTNRKALEGILETQQKSSSERRLIVDPVVEDMAFLWSKHLHKDSFEPTDDFFALGGHSLMATQIIFDVNKMFGTGLKLTDLMKAPTVMKFSNVVRRAMQTSAQFKETEGV